MWRRSVFAFLTISSMERGDANATSLDEVASAETLFAEAASADFLLRRRFDEGNLNPLPCHGIIQKLKFLVYRFA